MVEGEYEINWDVVYEILGLNKDFIDELYTLIPAQKHFLLSLLSLDVKEFTPWNKVAEHTRSIYKIKLTAKTFVKDIIEPIVKANLIETEKSTEGRGAKPKQIKLRYLKLNLIVALVM